MTAAPTAIDSSSRMGPASELADIPSSGTDCQWSATLFERHLEVMGSEQTSKIPTIYTIHWATWKSILV